jgi:hypothetical protein
MDVMWLDLDLTLMHGETANLPLQHLIREYLFRPGFSKKVRDHLSLRQLLVLLDFYGNNGDPKRADSHGVTTLECVKTFAAPLEEKQDLYEFLRKWISIYRDHAFERLTDEQLQKFHKFSAEDVTQLLDFFYLHGKCVMKPYLDD